jgi:hypothetical protein
VAVPLSRLHLPDIATEVRTRGIVADVSGTTIWRWLSDDAIRPWRHRSWIFPRDPNFKAKAGTPASEPACQSSLVSGVDPMRRSMGGSW